MILTVVNEGWKLVCVTHDLIITDQGVQILIMVDYNCKLYCWPGQIDPHIGIMVKTPKPF
jgi:hypothetical protein